jgi:hypothetical protein
MSTRNHHVCFVLCLFLLLNSPAFATSCINGHKFKVHQVCGRVQDKDGAVIPNASVSLNKPGNSEPIEKVSSDQEGNFQFSQMQSGEYELHVKYSGFWDPAQPFFVSHPTKTQTCQEPLRVVMKLAGSCSYIEKLNNKNAQTH